MDVVCDEHTKTTGSPVMFRRRLDRTADKSFDKLSNNDKTRLSTLRGALEDAKSRIVRLRDENDEKDYLIQEERQLRKATEENLQKYLVDMYKNPDVNSELYLRLPHAKRTYNSNHMPEVSIGNSHFINVCEDKNTLQTDIVNQCEENVEEFCNNSGPITNMELDKSAACRSNVASLSQPLVTADSSGSLEVAYHQTHHNVSQHSMRPRIHEPHLPESHFTSRHLEEPHDGIYHEAETWSTLKSMYQLLPPYISPAIYSSPFSPESWSSQESSIYQGLPQAVGHKGQQDKEQEKWSQREKNEHMLQETQITTQNLQTQNISTLSKPRPLISSHSTSLPSLLHIGNSGTSQPTSHTVHYLPYSTPRQVSPLHRTDPVSNTSRLLAEIATIKKENQELREKLKGARFEADLLNSSAKSTEDLSLNKIEALIEEIHNAEKKRSMAMEMLMGVADRDKHNSPEEENHLRKKFVNKSSQADIVYDSEFSEAEDYQDGPISTSESTMSDSGDSTQKILLKEKHIQELVTRQREIMKEEMQKVLDERNEARQRILKLEKKLATLELSHFTDNRSSNLLTKLRITERERDLAVSRLKYLAQDVNETKLMYNLHKALLSDDPTNHTSAYQEFKKSNLDIDPTRNPVPSKETEERAELETRIAMMERERQSQAHHIEKLEQLVIRQRHKLNSLCTGPILLDKD